MTADDQQEFLFASGDVPQLGLPQSDDPLVSDIAKAWSLPIGRRSPSMPARNRSKTPLIND
jgi:hypothetical protein